jgi:hypothetical protein
MNDLLFCVLFLWGFWLLYILVMGLYRAHLQGRLGKVATVLAYPAVLLGYAVDAFSNITLATLFFADLPRELLVTTRLKRYKAIDDGWRKAAAEWICTNLLDPFDPSGDHC